VSVTQQGIDRLLRGAGFPRHDGRTGLTKYSVGYSVTEGAVEVDGSTIYAVLVGWDGGHDTDPGHVREALAPLAETLGAAGYRVRLADLAPGGFEDLATPSLIVSAAGAEELRSELEMMTRRWDRVAKDCRALTAEVIAGLSTPAHTMIAVAGLPECQCGLPLGGGDASGSFITHALAVLAEERAVKP
jgi:hypothetical protein